MIKARLENQAEPDRAQPSRTSPPARPKPDQSKPVQPNGLNHSRAWVDLFGSAICTFEGGFGGRVALVVTTSEFATDALERLAGLPKFKGRVALVVLEHLHAAPIRHAIRQLEASVVIGLGAAQGIVTRGQAMLTEPGQFTASTGLEYVEASNLQGWEGGWLADKLGGEAGTSIVSGVAATQGLATASCDLANLERVLMTALG